jgi:hypothetical protein
MFDPFFCHWYVNGPVPPATTANVAVCPAVTVMLAGCVVIVGATADAFTVSVAVPLVTDPAVLVIVTLKTAPVSAVVVAGVVYVEEVAPAIAVPFFFH